MDCDKNMSFEECELAVLRSAVDKIDDSFFFNFSNLSSPRNFFKFREIVNLVQPYLLDNSSIEIPIEN